MKQCPACLDKMIPDTQTQCDGCHNFDVSQDEASYAIQNKEERRELLKTYENDYQDQQSG